MVDEEELIPETWAQVVVFPATYDHVSGPGPGEAAAQLGKAANCGSPGAVSGADGRNCGIADGPSSTQRNHRERLVAMSRESGRGPAGNSAAVSDAR
jgi:hypothetical protein